MQDVSGGTGPPAHAQRSLAGSIAQDESSVDAQLLKPLLQPFLAGVIGQLAAGGWKTDAVMGLLSSLLGACCGGKKGGGTGGGAAA